MLCRRYEVLQNLSSVLVIDAVKHLQHVEERCQARNGLGISVIGPDRGTLERPCYFWK